MERGELVTFTRIGQAFWVDPRYFGHVASETLSAVSVLQIDPELVLDRAASALLDRARRDGTAANSHINAEKLSQPFYRLGPDERMILIALHHCSWSYARIARVARRTPEQVEEMAWQARLNLAMSSETRVYPSGSKLATSRCPEYVLARPWSQRFLDDECEKTEQIFLQSHLMACKTCAQSLSRCRQLYYLAEKLLPGPESPDVQIRQLESVLASSPVRSRVGTGNLEAFQSFLRQRDVRVALLILGVLFVIATKSFLKS